MPRHRTPDTPAVDVQMDEQAVATAGAAAAELGRMCREIATRFDDGLPYSRERIVSEARFYMATSAEAMLEAGKRLIVLRQNEEHGSFTEIIEGQLGITPRTARHMMQAAARFLSPALAGKPETQRLIGLGRAKIIELLAEPDEALSQLVDGGTLAGRTIDEIEAMTRNELRAALKDARETIRAKDKVIAKKSEKIDRMAEEAERRRQLGESEKATLDELRRAVIEAELVLTRLARAVGAAMDAAPNESVQRFARQAAEYAAQRLADCLNEHGISVDWDQMIAPDFMGPEFAAARAYGEDKGKGGGGKSS